MMIPLAACIAQALIMYGSSSTQRATGKVQAGKQTLQSVMRHTD